MTITEMLGQSGLLTLLGMCVVFGFIIILICCMKLLQTVVHAFKLDKEAPAAQAPAATPAAPSASAAADNGAVVAAIAAAVHDRALNS
ncbi:MAG: OadG family protein [Treponema sp.]|nr:OadG family protein [Treponema sp.]